MKHLNKTYQLLIMAMIGTLLSTACSTDERTDIIDQPNADGTYSYTMHIDCLMPDSDSTTTRAVNSWDNGATIYLRFKSGSYYTSGTAVYNSSTGLWSVTTKSSLSISTSVSSCEATFFKNPSSVTSTQVNMTENTACFQGSGSYTHPNSSDIYANVTLNPKNWRLRFSGSSNTSFTILGNSSDISYYTSFNTSTGEFNTTKKDVRLTVSSNGYTPYIYGTFLSPSSSNNLTITNSNNDLFYRTINGLTLQSKNSGYLTIPTTSNYSIYSWKMLSATMSSTNYTYSGGTKYITITAPSNMSWTLSSDASSYVTLSKTSGTGNATVNVALSNNPNSYYRKPILTFKAGNITKTIALSQGYIKRIINYWNSSSTYSLYANAGDVLEYDYSYSGHHMSLYVDLEGPIYINLVGVYNHNSYYNVDRSGTYTFTTSGNYTIRMRYTIQQYVTSYYGVSFRNVNMIYN